MIAIFNCFWDLFYRKCLLALLLNFTLLINKNECSSLCEIPVFLTELINYYPGSLLKKLFVLTCAVTIYNFDYPFSYAL